MTVSLHEPKDDALAPFHQEEAAYRFVERCVWPAGPVCPHCQGSGRIRPLHGRTTRIGAYKCYDCRKPFTVKVGTVLESSNLPMHKWLQAILLIAAHAARPITVTELGQTLNIAPRTASYVLKRLAAAQCSDPFDLRLKPRAAKHQDVMPPLPATLPSEAEMWPPHTAVAHSPDMSQVA